MTRQSLAHAQRATPAQPEPLIQCLARLENISHSRVSQPVYHAKQVLIVAQSDSRAQVELVRMAMSALKDPSSPSHSTMSLEDCATLAITARAERSKSVIRADGWAAETVLKLHIAHMPWEHHLAVII